MICEHLKMIEVELTQKGIKETFRGKAWSDNCREWVYFDCYLNLKSIRKRINFDKCIVDHIHLGTHDGTETGFYCEEHKDGIMGVHKLHSDGRIEIK